MSAQRGPAGTWGWLAWWDHGMIDVDATLRSLPASDVHTAAAIADEIPGQIHYVHQTGTWYLWDGKCHRPALSGEAGRLASAYAERMRQMLEHAQQAVFARALAALPPGATEAAQARAREAAWEPWKPAQKYAAGLMKNAGQVSLLAVLANHRGTEASTMEEGQPGLLNFTNGTVNLATGRVHAHDPADMLTYCLDVPYDPRASCDGFLRLASRMLGCGGSGAGQDVLWYMLKLAGYSVLGDNREQKIVFINGPTGSGKSQFLRIIGEVLGDLAHNSPPELITVVKGNGRNARTENSIRGVRLLAITETSAYMSVDEAQLKRLTGEAWISVNQHYAKTEIKTPVTWTIWVATNQLPTLTNFDAAMRRRVIVIPGGPTVPEHEVDTLLAGKILSTEKAGIAALLVKACMEYHRSGIGDWPLDVRIATEVYQAEQNTVANFISDTMTVGGWSDGVPQHEAWEAYQLWARGSSRLGRNEFYDHLRKQPGMNYDDASRRFMGAAWNREWAAKGV